MKKILLISLISIFCFIDYCSSQSVGQDSEGYSSIVLPSSNFYLEVSEGKASYSFYKETWKKNILFNDLIDDNEAFNINMLEGEDENQLAKKIRTNLINNWSTNRASFNSSKRAKYFILGGEVSASTKEGVSKLFSENDFSKSNTLKGLVGFNKLKLKHNLDNGLIDSYIKTKIEIENVEYVLNENLITIESEINKLIRLGLLSANKYKIFMNFTAGKDFENINGLKIFITDIKALKNEGKSDAYANNLDSLKNLSINNIALINKIVHRDSVGAENNNSLKSEIEKNIIEIYKLVQEVKEDDKFIYTNITAKLENKFYDKEKWENVVKLFNDKLNTLEFSVVNNKENNFELLLNAYKKRINLLKSKIELDDKFTNDLNKIKYFTKTIYYLRGGYHGASFKLDKENAATTIDTRLKDINFDGYSLELGYTHQYRVRNYIGLSLGLSRLYNTDTLKSKKYIFQQVDPTISNGNFVTSEELIAYKGVYDTFLRFSVNFDFVHLIKLKEEINPDKNTKNSDMYLSLNPYIRHYGYDKSETLKNNTTLGLGLHAFNSKDNKLSGGIYVESSDTFGSNKFTPNKFGKRITIGIIAKFSFKGLKPESK